MSDQIDSQDLLEDFVGIMKRAYAPLIEIASSSDSATEALARLGVDATQHLSAAQLNKLVADLADAANALTVEGNPMEILASVRDVTSRVGLALGEAFPPELARALLDLLLIRLLQVEFPLLNATLALLGLSSARRITPPEAEISYVSWRMEWERFPMLVNDPQALFEAAYKWGTPDFDPKSVMRNFRNFFLMAGIPANLQTVDQDRVRALSDSSDVDPVLRIPLFLLRDQNVYTEVGLTLLALHPTVGGDQYDGLAIAPYGVGELRGEIDLGVGWTVTAGVRGEGVGGVGLSVRPTTVDFGLLDGSSSDQLALASSLQLSKNRDNEKYTILFGEPGGTRLQIGSAGLGSYMTLEIGQEPEFGVEAYIREGSLVIAAGQDAFLQKILPPDGITANFDFLLGWSTTRSVYFEGSGGLEITIPLHLAIGPSTIESIYLAAGLNFNTGLIEITGGLSFGAEIGPIAASVNRLGIILSTELSEAPTVSAVFLPPIGAGLSIDAGITGGGFVEFNTIEERYSGILALSFGEIAITAIGLITTKMPGGKKGFSLLINIGVIFDPPIELFSGFTLSGVGGLVGINRSMEIEVLQRGIKSKMLDSILFPDPKTVVANATTIISNMRAAFPPTEGQFVVGPMVRFGWGNPNIIFANIGIFIELPDPIRIVLMGQVKAAFPEQDNALVVINLDVLGALDFAKEVLTFQASLYDSKVLCFVIYGDSAFLLAWGNDPRFALSLGGFHPKFTPPPPPIIFADLKRLTIGISSGSDFQLTCQAYQALTPNSLQFGARVDLYAAVAGAVVTGYMGFEALFYFSPFSFEVWIGAGVSIKYQGASLADVELSFALSGPTPWNARGKAIIRILFIDVDVGFDITWGNSQQIQIAAENPWLKLEPALRAAGNWGSGLPRGRKMVEALRGAEGDSAELDTVRVHPTGRLEIKQNVVPLNTRLGKIGNAPIKDFNRFEIIDVRINKIALGAGPVQEFFSRGQFEQLNNQQKLSVPAFEKMPGGVVSSTPADVSRAGATESTALTYESIIIKADLTSEQQPNSGELDWAEAGSFVAVSNRQRALKRSGPRGRYMSVQPDPKVGASEEHYCVVNSKDLSLATLTDVAKKANENMTRMSADYALQAHLSQVPDDAGKLMVVPEYEVAA